MKKSNTKSSTKRFKSWAAVLALAALLVIMGLFTACPNAAGGNSGGSAGGGGSPPPSTVTEYTVKFSAEPKEGGTVTAKIKDGAAFTGGNKIAANTVLEFTAAPNSGYKVEKWEGEGVAVSTDKKTATLKVTKNAAVKAVFVKDSTPQPPDPPPAGEEYTVNFSAEPKEGGTLTAKIKDGEAFTGGNKVTENTVLEFTAAPKDGYRVKAWEGEGLTVSGDKKTAALNVTKDANVKVAFEDIPKHTVTFVAEPSTGGTITAKKIVDGSSINNNEEVYEGTEIEFIAVPQDGYGVKAWEGVTADPSDNKKAKLTVTGDTTVKVMFDVLFTVNFSTEPEEGGTISAKIKDSGTPVTSGSMVLKNTVLEFTAMPATAGKGYYVEGWEGGGLTVSDDRRTAELIVTANANVKVKFKEYAIENTNWDATAAIVDTGNNSRKFRLVISDTNLLTLFDNDTPGKSYFSYMYYDENTKTITLFNGGFGFIEITPTSAPLPTNWKIEFKKKNDKLAVGDLELNEQIVNVHVTFNKDNFIK